MIVTEGLIRSELEVATSFVKSAFVDFMTPVIKTIKISHARSFWGQIRSLGGNAFELKVSDVFNDIPNEENAKRRFLGMLVHELLHTVNGCMNHGSRWKSLANKVNALYPKLKVQRCTSMYEYGIKKDTSKFNYKITCHACSNTFFRQRKSDTTDPVFLNTFCQCGKCGARGKFEVIKI